MKKYVFSLLVILVACGTYRNQQQYLPFFSYSPLVLSDTTVTSSALQGSEFTMYKNPSDSSQVITDFKTQDISYHQEFDAWADRTTINMSSPGTIMFTRYPNGNLRELTILQSPGKKVEYVFEPSGETLSAFNCDYLKCDTCIHRSKTKDSHYERSYLPLNCYPELKLEDLAGSFQSRKAILVKTVRYYYEGQDTLVISKNVPLERCLK